MAHHIQLMHARGSCSLKISVIVTCYNIRDYIAQCLDSLINQTIDDIEFIVVDDCSTDGSTEIVKAYAKKDSRIRPVLLEKNTPGGTGIPSNIGMDMALGDYIGFADGDDWCHRDMFGSLYAAAVSSNADLAIANFQTYDDLTGEYSDPPEATKLNTNHLQCDTALKGLETKLALISLDPVHWRHGKSIPSRLKIWLGPGDGKRFLCSA